MTDSSSEKEIIADMAADLLETKLENAKKDTQMTHVLRMGGFHMEIVPSKDIDIEKMFKAVMDDLYKKFGDKVLDGSIEPQQRHYG